MSTLPLHAGSCHVVSRFKFPLRIILITAVALILFVLVLRCLLVLPVVDGDSIFFYPIYLSVAQTGELRHPFWSPFSAAGGPLTWHGWLQPLLLGHLTRLLGGTIEAALFVDKVIALMGVFLYVKATEGGMTQLPLIRVSGALITFFGLSGCEGRPELLAAAILIACCWVATSELSTQWKYIGTSIALGLLGITQPTVAVIATLLVLNILVVEAGNGRAWLTWIYINCGAAIIVVSLTLLLYPFPLTLWLEGLRRHGSMITSRTDSGLLLHYWFFDPFSPLQGLIIVGGLLTLLFISLKRRIAQAAPALALTIFAVWAFGVRIPPTAYNVMVFIPVAIIFVGGWLNTNARNGWHPRWVSASAAIMVTAIAAGSLLRLVPIANALLNERSSRNNLQQYVAQLERQHATVAMRPPLLVGSIPFSAWPKFEIAWDKDDACNGSTDRIILAQANSGQRHPPAVMGCKLEADQYADRTLLGYKTPFIPKGYTFAAYSKETSRQAGVQLHDFKAVTAP